MAELSYRSKERPSLRYEPRCDGHYDIVDNTDNLTVGLAAELGDAMRMTQEGRDMDDALCASAFNWNPFATGEIK